ncbi:MAG: hypothetical protein JO341_03605 [Gammaproteobacteria bacterium]|nr:hypothetical protein [Gammaproteobacteria bacterium]MBV9620086.1 hypothetical protein [Gammaproteobacteria bacterium]
MHRPREYRAALVFAAAIAASAMLPGCVVERTHEVHDVDHVPAPAHHWDDREDLAYRRYLEERHEAYVEFQRQNAEEQRAYWDWRARHPD